MLYEKSSLIRINPTFANHIHPYSYDIVIGRFQFATDIARHIVMGKRFVKIFRNSEAFPSEFLEILKWFLDICIVHQKLITLTV